jgi:hypothetical protein
MISRIRNTPAPTSQAPPKKNSESKAIYLTLIASFLGVAVTYTATHIPAAVSGIEPLLLILGLVLLIAAVRDWTFGIRALLVVVIVEGAVRKWFMPSATELVYFYKDVLMIAVLFGYWRKLGKPRLLIKGHLKVFSAILGLFLLYTVASLGMSDASHPLVGILGLKAYCLYIPLAFLTPRAFRSKDELMGFLKWYALLVLPVAVIGVMQFLESNPQSSLNRYAINEETSGRPVNIAVFSTASGNYFVRVTSTFSYVTGLSVYLPIMFVLLLAISSLNAKQLLARGIKLLYYGAIGAVVVTSFMTGSRTAVLAIAGSAFIFYFFTARRNTFRRLQQIAVLSVILYFAFSSLFPQAYDAFYTRTFGGEDRMNEGWSRITGALSLPVEEASYAGLFGYGVGLTQNAIPALMKRLDLPYENPIPIGYEGEPGRVMLELGMTGFMLYTLLRLVLLFMVFRMALAVRDPESKALAIAAAAALVFPLIGGGAISTHTLNVYQWFLVGMVMALLNAERLQLQAARPMPKLLMQAVPVHQ